mmetsp:Transcript_28904/g.58308  ORF Transcript_28904/g.58308 Transcript_28904/m.58308 type:complete len:205 (-) Transcript_28904:503-1117(-)
MGGGLLLQRGPQFDHRLQRLSLAGLPRDSHLVQNDALPRRRHRRLPHGVQGRNQLQRPGHHGRSYELPLRLSQLHLHQNGPPRRGRQPLETHILQQRQRLPVIHTAHALLRGRRPHRLNRTTHLHCLLDGHVRRRLLRIFHRNRHSPPNQSHQSPHPQHFRDGQSCPTVPDGLLYLGQSTYRHGRLGHFYRLGRESAVYLCENE